MSYGNSSAVESAQRHFYKWSDNPEMYSHPPTLETAPQHVALFMIFHSIAKRLQKLYHSQ